jgi:hypothetical protein
VIISKQLSTNILQDQMPKDGETPAFHMASYLLDVIFVRNIFTCMNLSWHVADHFVGEQVQDILCPHM